LLSQDISCHYDNIYMVCRIMIGISFLPRGNIVDLKVG